VIVHFAGGRPFFAGLVLVCLGILLLSWSPKRFARMVGDALVLGGGLAVLLSATPLPPLAYGAWALPAGALWLSLRKKRRSTAAGGLGLVGFTVISVVLFGWEWRYHRTPSVEVKGSGPVYVIGDSISAGLDPDEQPWPSRLARMRALEVINLARAGSRVSQALPQTDKIETEGAFVIVAIGGNDLLGATTAEDFRGHLEQLLSQLGRRGHRILMLELPLLPYNNGFGRAQRELASDYGAILVPKHRLAELLRRPGNTIDGIHLSADGHQAMAEVIGEVLE